MGLTLQNTKIKLLPHTGHFTLRNTKCVFAIFWVMHSLKI